MNITINQKKIIKNKQNIKNEKILFYTKKNKSNITSFNKSNFKTQEKTKIIFLGGLREIQRNCAVFEYQNESIMVDCGVGFCKDFGSNFILPNLYYFDDDKHNKSLKAIIFTHGHKDHIGGFNLLIKKLKQPIFIYGGLFTLDLLREQCGSLFKTKFKKNIDEFFVELWSDCTYNIKSSKYFKFSSYYITHSIPDAYLLNIVTPSSTIVHTGDFKFDLSPLSKRTDLLAMLKNGFMQPDVLLIDSTNADKNGFSSTEYSVSQHFFKLLRNNSKHDLIIPIFSSSINRIIQILKIAKLTKRYVVLLGRTLKNNLNLILKSKDKYLIDGSVLIQSYNIPQKPVGKLIILCTGTQGEENSALHKIINNKYKFFNSKRLKSTSIVFSSRVIPGNELSVIKSINLLSELNISVLNNNKAHASGHAYADDIRWMLNLIRPKNVIPVHGTYIKLKANVALAKEFGISKDKLFIAKNGDVYSVVKDVCKLEKRILHKDIFTTQNFEIINKEILENRKILGNNGLVCVNLIKNNKIFNIQKIFCVGITKYKIIQINKIINEINLQNISSKFNKINNDTNYISEFKQEFLYLIQKKFKEIYHYNNQSPIIKCFIN